MLPLTSDVVVVGAGMSGLWAAHHLLTVRPDLRVMVLEGEHVGYGASGRNGGWASAIFPATLRKVAALSSRDGAVRMQRAMNDTVVEVGRVAAAEGIDCGFQQGGYVSAATMAKLGQAAVEDIVKRPFITIGFATLVTMLPLAVTSTAGWIRRLGGKRWAALHRLAYLAGITAIVHYWWLVKADISSPIRYAIGIAALLGIRLFWARSKAAAAPARVRPAAQ